MRSLLGVLIIAAVAALAQSPQQLYQQALVKERSEGSLQEAIALYGRVAEQAGKNRALAAKALLQAASCYQKLGDTESRRLYERVIQEFGDQKDAVTTARARLASGASTVARVTVRQIWIGPQVATYAAIAPDERSIAFVDQHTGNLAIHDLRTGKDRVLTNKKGWSDSDEYAEELAFSPDGKRLAFAWFNKQGRYNVQVTGTEPGQTQRVLYANEDVTWLGVKDWSPDGRRIAVKLERKDHTLQIALLDADKGTIQVLKSVGWGDSSRMVFSPDGRYLAYDLQAGEQSPDKYIYVLAVDGSREVGAVEHPADNRVVGWSPDGKSLIFTSDRMGPTGVFAQPMDDGKPRGPAKLLRADLGGTAAIGLTKAGSLYYGVMPGSRDFQVLTVDLGTGKVLKAPVAGAHKYVGRNYGADWSADGRFLSWESYAPGRPNFLHIRSLESGQTRELYPALRYFNRARWSPDGRSLVASGTDLKGRHGVFLLDAQSGEAKPLVYSEPGRENQIPQWSAEGKKIYYRRGDPARKNDELVEYEVASGKERILLAQVDLRTFHTMAGGRLVCVTSDPATRRSSFIVLDVASGEHKPVPLPAHGFTDPVPTPDGRHILLRKDGGLWSVPVEGGEPRKLDWGIPQILDVRVHADGQRFAVLSRNDTPQEVWVAERLLSSRTAK